MNSILILLVMIFLHIVADYNLQGILASMKQIGYWETSFIKQGMSIDDFHKSMYNKDYLMALFMHSFAWTFLFMLPLMIVFNFSFLYIVTFIVNIVLHMYIDDLKANRLKINLVQDQLLHLLQIVVTWTLFFV